ncbi:hypothetical protein SO802_006267 [Lithocarpus litseifolius]|uniref:WPP domain-containing protein n=1 Tax=Lithocarpus litseifolius TaxID=425828 RepID=A0AAW2DLY2_9ROSI
MAADTAHMQCRGGTPRRDALQAVHLSKRYGTLLSNKASSAARLIEEEAFSTAAASASTEGDGIKILQVYSHEISRRMLDTVKTRASFAVASSIVDVGIALQTPSLEAASAPLPVRITLLPSPNLNLSLGFNC